MGPRYRAPRNPTRSQISSAKTVQTWHYILRKPLTALNDINALRARGSVYCSSRVKELGRRKFYGGLSSSGLRGRARVDIHAARRAGRTVGNGRPYRNP